MADNELADVVVETKRLLDAAQAAWLGLVAELDRRSSYGEEGAVSTTAFVAAECGMSGREAAEALRLGQALTEMPETRRAVGDGRVSVEQARVLARAAESHLGHFQAEESALVAAAEGAPVAGLTRQMHRWAEGLDRRAAEQGLLRLRHRRRLSLSSDGVGMGRIDGQLDPDSFEVVRLAIGSLAEPDLDDPGDTRTPAQRRADALVELCRRHLDGDNGSGRAANRPHLNLIMDAGVLDKDGSGRCEHPEGRPIPAETGRRLSCDATLCRVAMAGSEVLELGRKHRVVSPALRRAVELRDRHCVWPGCDRPGRWCDAHHIVHFADGGPTDLANLVLLCRRHHTATHEDGYALDKDREGGLIFTRPDGTVIEHRRGPPGQG
jgi:hypothetical protein